MHCWVHIMRENACRPPASASLAQWALPIPAGWGCVAKLSPRGAVQAVLLDPPGADNRVSSVAAATEYKGRLYLGNLGGSGISVVGLAEAGLGSGVLQS